MAKYSQGICGDGAAILEDGRIMTADEIVARLNELEKTINRLLPGDGIRCTCCRQVDCRCL